MYNETENRIEFAFPLEDLFANASLQTLYAAKNMPSPMAGQDAADVYGITSDERPFFTAHIPMAVSDLFAIFIKQTDHIVDSMFTDKILGTNPNALNCCGFSIARKMQGDKPLYNPNRLAIIDSNCFDYLKNYILLEWAKANAMVGSVAVYADSLAANERQIRNNNFELKKGGYEKSYVSSVIE